MAKKKKKTKEEKAAEAAEKAELAAIAAEEARVEAERLEAERLRLEKEAQDAADAEREAELGRLGLETETHAPLLAAREAQIAGIDAAVADRAEWGAFVQCDPAPSAAVPAQVNTGVLELLATARDAETIQQQALSVSVGTSSAGATKLMMDLELLCAEALENKDYARVAYALQKGREVHGAISELIDAACADALESPLAKLTDHDELTPAKRQIDFDVAVARAAAAAALKVARGDDGDDASAPPPAGATEGLRFGLWASTDPGMKQRGRMKIAFPNIGINIKLPKSISSGSAGNHALRAMCWPVDHITAGTVPDEPRAGAPAPADATLAQYDEATVALATAKFDAWLAARPAGAQSGLKSVRLPSGEVVPLSVQQSMTSTERRDRALAELPWALQRSFVGRALHERKWIAHVAAPPAVAVVGGVFSVELLTLPGNARTMKTWKVRHVDATTGVLQHKPFPGDGALAAHMLPITIEIKLAKTVLVSDVQSGPFDEIAVAGAVVAAPSPSPTPSPIADRLEGAEGDTSTASKEGEGGEGAAKANDEDGAAEAKAEEVGAGNAEKDGDAAAEEKAGEVAEATAEAAEASPAASAVPISVAAASGSGATRLSGTRLAWHNPESGTWDSSVISDLEWDSATRKLAFNTMRTGTFAVIQPRNSELPFKSWSAEPMEEADLTALVGASEADCATVLCVQGQASTFHIGVGDGVVRLLGPDIPEMAGLRLKAMRPGTLLAALAKRGAVLTPSLDDMARLGVQRKKGSLERASNFEISVLASGFKIESSPWNLADDPIVSIGIKDFDDAAELGQRTCTVSVKECSTKAKAKLVRFECEPACAPLFTKCYVVQGVDPTAAGPMPGSVAPAGGDSHVRALDALAGMFSADTRNKMDSVTLQRLLDMLHPLASCKA